jgi:hypothetical protein
MPCQTVRKLLQDKTIRNDCSNLLVFDYKLFGIVIASEVRQSLSRSLVGSRLNLTPQERAISLDIAKQHCFENLLFRKVGGI